MTTNPTDLAAALNECMPLTIDDCTYTRAVGLHGYIYIDNDHSIISGRVDEDRIIGILCAEYERRGLTAVLVPGQGVSLYRTPNLSKCVGSARGLSALSHARAFAAAKRAEGGGA